MDGIAGGLTITQQGKVKYEVVDDRGSVQQLIIEAYLIPTLRCRLFSPQAYFKQLYDDGTDSQETCGMTVKRNKTLITLANGSEVTVYYDRQTYLPRIHVYH
jgi:hypothetical protein